MAHKIKVLEEGIVEITHTGQMTINEATNSRNEAAAVMTDRDLKKVLADVSAAEHSTSTADMFKFNASHYEVFPPHTRLAVVIPPDPANTEPAEFAKTVAVNRGIMMRIFLDKSDAMSWLKKVK